MGFDKGVCVAACKPAPAPGMQHQHLLQAPAVLEFHPFLDLSVWSAHASPILLFLRLVLVGLPVSEMDSGVASAN